MEHLAHQFDALDRAVVDEDWDTWCKAMIQGFTEAIEGDTGIGETLGNSLEDWRTLAMPNGKDFDSDRNTFETKWHDAFSSSSKQQTEETWR